MLARLIPALLLAGCLAPAATIDDAPPPGSAVTELLWGVEGCEAIIGLVPVEAAALADRVPEGFRLLTPAEMGLPDDPRGDAVLGMEVFRCASGQGLTGVVDDLAYASYFAPVEPPAEHKRDDVLFNFLKWDVLVPDEPRRARLAEAGVPAVAGDASFARFERAGAGYAGRGSATLEGAGGFTATAAGAVPAPAEQREFVFLEFTATPAGLVVWEARVDASRLTIGPVDYTDISGWPASVLGAGPAAGYAYVGEVTFTEASIRLP